MPHLFGALSVATSKDARANCGKPTCGSLRRRLHRAARQPSYSRALTFAMLNSGHLYCILIATDSVTLTEQTDFLIGLPFKPQWSASGHVWHNVKYIAVECFIRKLSLNRTALGVGDR
jgi:hypothetical protein